MVAQVNLCYGSRVRVGSLRFGSLLIRRYDITLTLAYPLSKTTPCSLSRSLFFPVPPDLATLFVPLIYHCPPICERKEERGTRYRRFQCVIVPRCTVHGFKQHFTTNKDPFIFELRFGKAKNIFFVLETSHPLPFSS